MFQREVGDFFQVLRIPFRVQCSHAKVRGCWPGVYQSSSARPGHPANCVFCRPPRNQHRTRLPDDVSYSRRWILTPNGYHERKSRLYFIVLREDVGKVLSQKAKELQHQLSRLGTETGVRNRGRVSLLKGRKVAVNYRDKSGKTWAGRGVQPIWLREKLKAGSKLDDFTVQTVADRTASPKKFKRRRAKR
jgi:H-NS histone family